jgi:polyisoprenoid-binding protein YceI
MIPHFLVAAALLLSATGTDSGRQLDVEDVFVTFTLGAVAHTVEGTIPVTSADVQIDPASGELSGEIVLDARGADTGNRRRDRKMHEDVLLSNEHPEIVFVPDRFEGTMPESGSSRGTLYGRVRLLGVEHDVELSTRLERADGELALEADLRVPYVEWGLEDPSVFVLRVEKHVDVRVEATLGLPDAESRDDAP